MAINFSKRHPYLSITLLFLGLTASYVSPRFLAAESDQKSAVEIKHKSRDLDKVKAELNRKKEEKERLSKEAQELSNELQHNQIRMKDIEQTLLHTQKKTFDVEQQVARTKNQRDKMLTDLQRTEDAMKRSFRTYYVASALLGPGSEVPVFTRQLIESHVSHWNQIDKSQDAEGKKLDELVSTDQLLRNEVQHQEGDLTSLRSGLEDKQKLLSKKMSRREILEAELKELQQTAEELASLIDMLRSKAKEEREGERRARLEEQASGHSPILPNSLPWPVSGKVVMRFGRQIQPTLGTPFISNGVIISMESPQPVKAVADGHVLFAGKFLSYGSMTVLEHAGDWYTVYGRLSKWDVEKGQDVKKGDTIGMSRAAEKGGAEMYFELRFYGKPTDPMPWLIH